MDADNCISRNTSKKRLLESDSDLELDCCCDSDCSTPKKCLKKMNTKQTKRRQKYKSLWEKEHGAWLTNDPQNEYNAKCKLCGVIFTIASAGIGQICAQDEPLDQIVKINATELLSGLHITDELKGKIIECIGAEGNGEPAYKRCPEVPMTDALKQFLSLNQVINKVAPAPLSKIEQAKKTLISNPLSKLVNTVQTVLEEAPTKVTEAKAALSGAKKDAEVLVVLSGQIVAVTNKPSSHDPYQDISGYLKSKNPSNIKNDPEAVVKNKIALENIYANTDINSLRRYGANYNPLVPAVLEVGLLRTLLHS